MSHRRDEVFTVLKAIRRIVDETHDHAERAITDADDDRTRADELAPALAGDGARIPNDAGSVEALIEKLAAANTSLEEFHAFCHRLIDERETLATTLERLDRTFAIAGLVPRTRNLGKGGRTAAGNGRAPLDALGTNPVVLQRLAKFLVQHCVRDSELETLHAGMSPSSVTGDYTDVVVTSPFGAIPWPRVSRFNDDEMKRLMIDIVDRVYLFLHTLFHAPVSGDLLAQFADQDPVPDWNVPTLGGDPDTT